VSLNRRSFLKSSSLAVAAAVSGSAPHIAAAEANAATTQGSATSPAILVNILQGTESTGSFSRGNTLPIAALPFGMAHWTLQSKANTSWMFTPSERRLQGFRCTHQLSPWLGDYGHATFLPYCGEINPDAGSRSSSWRPEEASLHPHSMKLRLMRYSIDTELVPTERCALITATYTKPQAAGFLIDIPGDHGPVVQDDRNARVVRFTSTANEGGVPKDFATYYVLQFSAPWKTLASKPLKGHTLAQLDFADDVKQLEVRIGTSFISFEQAALNLQRELGTRPLDTVRSESEAVWNEQLNTITISGATERQQRTFYSCLYRTLLFPRVWHELDASNSIVHRSAYNGQVVPGVMYADHGYWDVYRAWYPMMTLLFPARLAEMLQSWVNAYKEGGWLPQFPCPGYRACMTGSLIDAVFGDAAAKGLPGFDLATAYEGLHKHATQPGNPDAGYGRRGIEAYMRYGYAPAGVVSQSAAETVDQAYGDFCIAQVAKALGKHDDEAMFMKRSENWKHIFDKQTGFIRGKKADGTWLEPFDPIRWGDPYVEGSAWQHRFDVWQDLPGLIEALGGNDKAVEAIDAMLARAPEFNVGHYGGEIHEMSEMAAVDFGQYAHSNQPVHHVLYIYSVAGRLDRTRHWTHRVMNELYTPDTFAGDEDTGSMAAWYILSALGFFPVCPGKAEYALGHALFPSATVKLPGGKTLKVEASSLDRAKGHVSLNGSTVERTMVSHAELAAGGTLRFG
jgi:predicted alpha-1,2-mannosidase